MPLRNMPHDDCGTADKEKLLTDRNLNSQLCNDAYASAAVVGNYWKTVFRAITEFYADV